eukprot:COSAG05_NODE_5505_length_1157_cov_2.094518_1_plen_129_part_00
MQPAQGHEAGYAVELPTADFKRIVGKAAPILKVTCSMLRVVSAVASPIAKLAGMDLPLDYVNPASFSPDGTKIVSGSDDTTVRIWDAVSGDCEQTLEGHSRDVTSASFSPDGTKVVSGSGDKTVRICY